MCYFRHSFSVFLSFFLLNCSGLLFASPPPNLPKLKKLTNIFQVKNNAFTALKNHSKTLSKNLSFFKFLKKQGFHPFYVHFVPIYNPYLSPYILNDILYIKNSYHYHTNHILGIGIRIHKQNLLWLPPCSQKWISEKENWISKCILVRRPAPNFNTHSIEQKKLPAIYFQYYFSNQPDPKTNYQVPHDFKVPKQALWFQKMKQLINRITNTLLPKRFDYFGGKCQFLAFLIKNELKKLFSKIPSSVQKISYVHILHRHADFFVGSEKDGIFIKGVKTNQSFKKPLLWEVPSAHPVQSSIYFKYHTALLITFLDQEKRFYFILDPTSSLKAFSLPSWKKAFQVESCPEQNTSTCLKILFINQPYILGGNKYFYIYFEALLEALRSPEKTKSTFYDQNQKPFEKTNDIYSFEANDWLNMLLLLKKPSMRFLLEKILFERILSNKMQKKHLLKKQTFWKKVLFKIYQANSGKKKRQRIQNILKTLFSLSDKKFFLKTLFPLMPTHREIMQEHMRLQNSLPSFVSFFYYDAHDDKIIRKVLLNKRDYLKNFPLITNRTSNKKFISLYPLFLKQ